MAKSIYEGNGYKNRTHYLTSLAEEYGEDLGTVIEVANMLGESEDFDGLVAQMEDGF